MTADGRRRAVILQAPDGSRAAWLRECAEYAHARGLDVTVIASTTEAAMSAVADGEADVLIVGRAEHLGALVQVVHGAKPASVPPAARRTVRLR